MDAPGTDGEIVQQALVDKEVFGVLVTRYSPRLARYVRRLGIRNPPDVDDILQEIFIKTYRNLNGFDTGLSFSSWIYRIAHNETMSWFRKRTVRPEGHLVADGDDRISEMFSGDDAEDAFDQKIDADLLNAALLKLPAQYREVLVLRYFEGYGYQEISDILQIPIGSVATLIHRAKKKLKELVLLITP